MLPSSARDSLEAERHSPYSQGIYGPKEKKDNDPIITDTDEREMHRSERAQKKEI